jgi:tetratricopeptide (TPR) repeat protein
MSRTEPLPLTELFTRYLERQMAAQAQGLGFPEPDGDVVPHEAVPVQPVDPQLAWQDTQRVLGCFGLASHRLDVVPDWAVLVSAQEPVVALAFSLGNFPQMVRNFHALLTADPAALRLLPARSLPAPALWEWARQASSAGELLLAAGVLRLARHFDEAAELLARAARLPAEWQPLRANEEAALAWHRGRCDEAAALWQTQNATVPVLFNRGMAALSLGQPAAAREALTQAVAELPDTSAWHHLGHLYLALAAARG